MWHAGHVCLAAILSIHFEIVYLQILALQSSSKKNQFHKISLLEAHNFYFKYDVISLCETSLIWAIKVPENILKGYNLSLRIIQVAKKGVLVYFMSPYPSKLETT